MRSTFLPTLIIVSLLAACGGGSGGSADPADTAEMMAAALDQLVSKDHTFGDGPPPFTEYLIQDHTISDAIPGEEDTESEPSRPLTEQERSAVEDAVSEYGETRWIADSGEWQTDDLQPTIEGSAILGVGVPRVDGDVALVPVSLWCSGLCGTWLTYRLELDENGTWQVTGTEGPIAIS